MIFVVGARRSGTYWLQRVVTAHPAVSAVPSESHLFSHGIKPLFERFHHGARGSPVVGSLYVDREELLDATRDFCDRVLAGYLEPGAARLAERTAPHVLALDVIAEVYPDSRLLHIVRDGRDVARSVRSHAWDQGPATIEEAATEWRDSVAAGRRSSEHPGYFEMRYEDLLADPRARIGDLYRVLGLEVTDEAIEAALAEAGVTVNVDPREPQVGHEKWRESLSEEELRAIQAVAGDLLAELGYADASPPERPASPGRRPMRERARRLAARGRPRSDIEAMATRAVKLMDDVLGCLHGDGTEKLGRLLASDVVLELVTADLHRRRRGEEAREELIALASTDPVAGARQVRGEVFPGYPTVAAVSEYELSDGARATRVVVLTVRDGRAARIALCRLPDRTRGRRERGE